MVRFGKLAELLQRSVVFNPGYFIRLLSAPSAVLAFLFCVLIKDV
jgi:hypothetical protein